MARSVGWMQLHALACVTESGVYKEPGGYKRYAHFIDVFDPVPRSLTAVFPSHQSATLHPLEQPLAQVSNESPAVFT